MHQASWPSSINLLVWSEFWEKSSYVCCGKRYDTTHFAFGEYGKAESYPQTSTSDSRLSEWWCFPDNSESLDFSPSAALEVADEELQSWLSRYNPFIARGLIKYCLMLRTIFSNICTKVVTALGSTSTSDTLNFVSAAMLFDSFEATQEFLTDPTALPSKSVCITPQLF